MIFTLQIDEHLGQFGATAYAEQQVLRELLAQVALAITSLDVATEASPAALTLNRMDGHQGVAIVVGSFFFGDASHAVSEANARAAAQAEASKANASKSKSKAA